MRDIRVWVTEKNYELPVAELVPWKFDDLVNHRVFETMDDVHYTLLALSRGSRFALERGLACPADTRHAIEYIESLNKY